MCVAIVVPSDSEFPSLETLKNCEYQNDDGGGIAWDMDGEVHWMKGLDAATIHEFGKDLYGCTKLIHFRLATAGGKGHELAHPFPIEKNPRLNLSGRAKSVLIHNGHWSEWSTISKFIGPLPNGPWSDTRLMARLIALHGKKILNEFSGQKIAVMDGRGDVSLQGSWDEYQECYFSNTYWKYTKTGGHGGYHSSSDEWEAYRNWWHKNGKYEKEVVDGDYVPPKRQLKPWSPGKKQRWTAVDGWVDVEDL